MKYFEEMAMNIAQKLLEEVLEQKMHKWMKKFDGFAQQYGIDPAELRKFLKPLIQKALDKHFSN